MTTVRRFLGGLCLCGLTVVWVGCQSTEQGFGNRPVNRKPRPPAEKVAKPEPEPKPKPKPARKMPRPKPPVVQKSGGETPAVTAPVGKSPAVPVPVSAPPPPRPVVYRSPETVWEIEKSLISDALGCGGLESAERVPDELLKKGIEENGIMPPDPIAQKGFYFVGAGRVLPECALRIYRPEQIRAIKDEARRPGGYTDEFWAGPTDCSALAWLVRDERDLVVMMHVTDDLHVTLPIEDALTVSDGVELFLDIRRQDRGVAAFGKGVFHMLLVPSRGGTVRIRFGAEDQAVSGARANWRLTETGYRMLIRIPLEQLGWKHGYAGSAFNVDLAIRDSDTTGSLDTLMVWSGDERNVDDARLFGRLRAVRRGYYLSTKPLVARPEASVMRAKTRFHVRGGGPGGGSWDSTKDCSATAWVDRSEDGFAVTVEVQDDVLEVSAVNPWERDGVELFFDVRPDATRGRAAHGRGVFQLICAAREEGGSIEPQFGGDPMVTRVAGVTTRCRIVPGGYVVDFFIPMAGLEENHMIPGERFNFDFVVNDADSPGGRDTMLCWAGDGDNWQNAAAYGRLEPLEE